MNTTQQESNGATRLAYILGVPLADDVVRQWPQMGEIVRTSQLVADIEGNFPRAHARGRQASSSRQRRRGGVDLRLRRRTPVPECHHRRTRRRPSGPRYGLLG